MTSHLSPLSALRLPNRLTETWTARNEKKDGTINLSRLKLLTLVGLVLAVSAPAAASHFDLARRRPAARPSRSHPASECRLPGAKQWLAERAILIAIGHEETDIDAIV